MTKEMSEALRKRYGHAPEKGEQWVIYNNLLIVIKAGAPPRAYDTYHRCREWEPDL